MLTTVFVSLLLIILGLCLGSFINLLTVRIAQGEAVLTVRSRCPRCRHALSVGDLVPVASFLLLGRRCRYCREPISWRYPLVELAAAFLLVAIAAKYRLDFGAAAPIAWGPRLARDVAFTAGLLTLFVFDYSWYIVPDMVSLPLAALGVIVNLALGVTWTSLVMGMALGGSFYAALWFISAGRWVGSGDIRLGVVLGAMLGLLGTIVALELAYLLGATVAVALLLSSRKSLTDRLPMGAFLATGAWLTLLFAPQVDRWLSLW